MNKPTSNPNASFSRWLIFSVAFTIYLAAGLAYNYWAGKNANPILQILFLPATAIYSINPVHAIADQSMQGGGIDTLNWAIHGLMAVLFVGWVGYFCYVIFRFRRNVNPVADYTGVKSHISNYVEGLVALVEGVLLIGLAIPLWAHAVQTFPNEKDPNTVVIRVIGQQFLWNAWYPGPDGFGSLDLTSGNVSLDMKDPKSKGNFIVKNDIYVPEGRKVLVHISSRDVIHSFACKPLRVTQDAIPGMNVPAWFQPMITGQKKQFWINCAQLCGNGHYSMKGSINVVTEEEYKKWLAGNSQSAAQSSGGYE
ncbi:MAG: coxM [Verrucomicrobiales bacterium]|nr:coxM [Verrucomicrobiales bacterium]